MDTCKQKQGFPDWESAKAQAKLQRGFAKWRGRVKPYHCPHCKRWHLTSIRSVFEEIAT